MADYKEGSRGARWQKAARNMPHNNPVPIKHRLDVLIMLDLCVKVLILVAVIKIAISIF